MEQGHLCLACNNPSSQFCSRCRNSRYCSQECQQTDWPTHKLLCRSFSTFDLPNRPSPEHFRAIYFPPDQRKPVLIWLHCPWHDGEDSNGRSQYPDQLYLGIGVFPSEAHIQFNPTLNRQLSDTIRYNYRYEYLTDGSRPNRSILAIANPKTVHDWRGPMLAYGTVGLGEDQKSCRNLDLNDFRHIVDHFNSHPSDATVDGQRHVYEKVTGVKINCVGAQKVCNAPPFEAVEVPLTHPIFHKQSTSDMAARIGLPILTRRCPPDNAWADPGRYVGRDSPFSNPAATVLHLICDKDSKDPMGWGWAPLEWQSPPGSVLVVRQDKNPLLPLHAEALSRYCEDQIAPLFRHALGEYAPEEPMSKDNVLAAISRPTFVVFWGKVRSEHLENCGELVRSPYEV